VDQEKVRVNRLVLVWLLTLCGYRSEPRFLTSLDARPHVLWFVRRRRPNPEGEVTLRYQQMAAGFLDILLYFQHLLHIARTLSYMC
jgi:hypothetical protein